ncbi:uncharacterized protein G2W53_042785 [Senna tora]|uniref:Uncharacterized protein n=1 Tax=Senna tora TaxID=362788 RepID=A0A834W483_9FABA|nr:uncharacterized protein G2W53_042785 [Senna tora]
MADRANRKKLRLVRSLANKTYGKSIGQEAEAEGKISIVGFPRANMFGHPYS